MSIHPTITNKEVAYVCVSIKSLVKNFKEWARDYQYNATSNEFEYKYNSQIEKEMVEKWFSV